MGSHTQPFPKRLGGSYQSLPLPLPLKKGPGEGKGEFSRVEILRMEEEEKEEEREGLYPQAVEGEEPGLLVGAGLQKEQCLWAGFELREGEGQSPLEVIGQVGVTVGSVPTNAETKPTPLDSTSGKSLPKQSCLVCLCLRRVVIHTFICRPN